MSNICQYQLLKCEYFLLFSVLLVGQNQQFEAALILILLTDLVVHECVESLPVALYLGGDVFILQDHTSCSTLPPLCRKIQSIVNVWHMAFWGMFVSQVPDSYILSNVHRLSCTVPLCCRWGHVILVYGVSLFFWNSELSSVAAKMSPRRLPVHFSIKETVILQTKHKWHCVFMEI